MRMPPAAEPVGYERLARIGGRHDWWRPVAGTLLLMVLIVLGDGLVFGTADRVGEIRHIPEDADGWPLFGDVTEVAVGLLAAATVLPAIALTVHWIQRRPWGSVSSVDGRLRWRWLGLCLVVATAAVLVAIVGGGVLVELTDPVPAPAEEEAAGVDAGTFLAGLAVVVCLVPFQAAGEEYLFRGWLLQATGMFFRSPWVVLAPQAVLFAAAHGWGTPWGFVDLTVFGVVAGWLTTRTGGLEAVIALHVMTNVIGMGLAASFAGGLASDETAADMPWSMALVDMAVCCLFAAVVLGLARGRSLVTHLPPAQAPMSGDHVPGDQLAVEQKCGAGR